MAVEIALPQPTGQQTAPANVDAGTTPASEAPVGTAAPAAADASAAAPPATVVVTEPAETNWPVTILAGIAIVAALYFGEELFVPLLLAALISYALDPIHRRL